jgi:hypothetical protein
LIHERGEGEGGEKEKGEWREEGKRREEGGSEMGRKRVEERVSKKNFQDSFT